MSLQWLRSAVIMAKARISLLGLNKKIKKIKGWCFTSTSLFAAELKSPCHHRLAYKLLAGQFVQPLIHKEHRGLEEPRGRALPLHPPPTPPGPGQRVHKAGRAQETHISHKSKAAAVAVRTLTRARGLASWSSREAAWALCPEARSACSSGDGGGGGGRAPRTTRTAELERERGRREKKE